MFNAFEQFIRIARRIVSAIQTCQFTEWARRDPLTWRLLRESSCWWYWCIRLRVSLHPLWSLGSKRQSNRCDETAAREESTSVRPFSILLRWRIIFLLSDRVVKLWKIERQHVWGCSAMLHVKVVPKRADRHTSVRYSSVPFSPSFVNLRTCRFSCRAEVISVERWRQRRLSHVLECDDQFDLEWENVFFVDFSHHQQQT